MRKAPESHERKDIFSPLHLKNTVFANRMVMAPMTRALSPDGIVTDQSANYYRKRVDHGVGLVITEGVLIEHSGAGHDEDIPKFYGENALQRWRHIVDEVHDAGGKIFPQLWHVGIERKPRPQREHRFPKGDQSAYGPSAMNRTDVKNIRPLDLKGIDLLIEAYAQAAESAEKCGFDGVELHGAHGYLIDQFMRSSTNRRTDEYGVSDPTRFAREIVQAIRGRVSDDFLISYRFSQWTVRDYSEKLARTPEELERVLQPLAAAGVDIFHPSTRRFFDPAFSESDLTLAGWTKAITGKTTIAVGSVGIDKELERFSPGSYPTHGDIDLVCEYLDRQEFDLIAVGRALISNPSWVDMVRSGVRNEYVPYSIQALDQLS